MLIGDTSKIERRCWFLGRGKNWNLEILFFDERAMILRIIAKFLGEETTGVPRVKHLRARKITNKNSTHIFVSPGIDWNPGHTGGGECSHHCAIPACSTYHCLTFLSTVNFTAVCRRGYMYVSNMIRRS